MKTKKHICANCMFQADDDSDYCPRCGILFIEKIKCKTHPKDKAVGVCLVCENAYCVKCLYKINNTFLCSEHDSYEIYEGMVKIFGTSDEIQIHYLKNCLEENSFHPFIYSRKSTPMHLGGIDYSLFRAVGDSSEYILNEIKLLVPGSEVLMAEKLIKELSI